MPTQAAGGRSRTGRLDGLRGAGAERAPPSRHSLAAAQVVHVAQRALDLDGVTNGQALQVLAHLACRHKQRAGAALAKAWV